MKQRIRRVLIVLFCLFCLFGYISRTPSGVTAQKIQIDPPLVTRGLADTDKTVVINVSRNLFDWVPIIALAGTWLITFGYNKRKSFEMMTKIASIQAEVAKHKDECNAIPKAQLIQQMADISRRVGELHTEVSEISNNQIKITEKLAFLVGRQQERDRQDDISAALAQET